jgi:hypothetical protein
MIRLEVGVPREGEPFADFSLCLPAGRGRFTRYRFLYMHYPADPSLDFAGGTNSPANCSFYRICEAHIGRLEGGRFLPDYRILQSGEIGFALRERGAGDFVGGFHGDEIATELSLLADGRELALDAPSSGEYREVRFLEKSTVFRCNTPDLPLLEHRQLYTASGSELSVSQSLGFLAEPLLTEVAYMPMLTVERIDPALPDLRLTDTLTFYEREGGECVAVFDTAPFGVMPEEGLPPSPRGIPAAAVLATGRESGLRVAAGLRLPEGSPLAGQVRASVWIRYGNDLDSKVYFNIAGGMNPKVGDHLEAEVYYKILLVE